MRSQEAHDRSRDLDNVSGPNGKEKQFSIWHTGPAGKEDLPRLIWRQCATADGKKTTNWEYLSQTGKKWVYLRKQDADAAVSVTSRELGRVRGG